MTDNYFFLTGVGQFPNNNCRTEKTAGKTSCKGGHGKKIQQLLITIQALFLCFTTFIEGFLSLFFSRPQYFGKACKGSSRGHFKLCNPKVCHTFLNNYVFLHFTCNKHQLPEASVIYILKSNVIMCSLNL